MGTGTSKNASSPPGGKLLSLLLRGDAGAEFGTGLPTAVATGMDEGEERLTGVVGNDSAG